MAGWQKMHRKQGRGTQARNQPRPRSSYPLSTSSFVSGLHRWRGQRHHSPFHGIGLLQVAIKGSLRGWSGKIGIALSHRGGVMMPFNDGGWAFRFAVGGDIALECQLRGIC